MARDHARIECSIWEDDDDWNALSGPAMLLYVFLLSQRELTYAGLLPLRLRRWTKKLPFAAEEVSAALAELDARRFLVVDRDAEEVLVRSLIRRDGIWKQPQVLAAALRESFAITSTVLRTALAAELRRLPVEVTGPAPEMTAAALLAGAPTLPPAVKAVMEERRRAKATKGTAAARPGSAASVARRATRPARPAAAPAAALVEHVDQADVQPAAAPELRPHETVTTSSDNPARNPSSNPSGKALGVGGGGKGCSVPVLLSASSVGGDARAHESAPTREDAARLVAEVLPGQPAKVADKLVTEVAALLAEGIGAAAVVAGLRLWSGKRLGVGLLAELVGEAMRAPQIDAAEFSRPPRNSDERVASAFALAAHYATEDGDDTELGRLLRSAAGGGTSGMGVLLSGAAA
ncbi:hypothetical protein [Lentzea aerocolonigenes]|uniref:hypothetical protein n=1 Tax=Lentzea aerocolonigenes TaxID=68170 RepID=UPI00069819B9|nr:hypothetical protein [Lentzea aerocolonigenes]